MTADQRSVAQTSVPRPAIPWLRSPDDGEPEPWTAPPTEPSPDLESAPALVETIDTPAVRWAWRVALTSLLGATAVLYLWNLGASGWANAYYSAAALAGSQSWTALLFGSFDAGNAITVDKTPASIWVMALSVRLFGLSSWSVLVPQALMGVGAVALLTATVGRAAGRLAGILAGLVLAITPVAALMFRFNNPDALLVLLLVAGAYGLTRAIETASTRWIVFAGAMVGFAFLAKMLQAFLVIPAFTLAYLWAAPTTLPRRFRQVAAAAAAVTVSAGWYVALVMLWPADARPYIGGSQTNSILDLLLGYNGFGRITGDEVGRIGGGGPFSEGSGILRLFQGELATEASWLLPAALIAGLLIFVARRALPRTDPIRGQVLLWGGWLLVTGLVFSLMQGIFHEYYSVALAPPIGALVAIGAGLAWRHRRDLAVSAIAIVALIASTIWTVNLLGLSPTWNPWLAPSVLALATLAAVATLLAAWGFVPSGWIGSTRGMAFTAGLAALLLVPGIASIATAAEPHTGALPTAAPQATVDRNQVGFGRGGFPAGGGNGGGRFGTPGQGGFAFPGNGGGFNAGSRGGIGGLLNADAASPALVAALQQDASAYTWTAATTGANNAAGLALSSKTSVMSIGGFNGTDPSPTLEQFQADVAAGRIHYYVATQDAAGFRGAQGGSNIAAQIARWVTSNFAAQSIGGATVFDLTTPAS